LVRIYLVLLWLFGLRKMSIMLYNLAGRTCVDFAPSALRSGTAGVQNLGPDMVARQYTF